MKKMYINRAPVSGPWGGGNNFVKALYQYAPDYEINPTNKLTDDVDIIFMIDPRYDQTGVSIREIEAFKTAKPNTKIVYRINECDARKGDINTIDPIISYASKHVDLAVFISEWIMNYHCNLGWMCHDNMVIYSGTNKSHFSPQEKIHNGKINLVTHHWSDNPYKGQDIYEMLDTWIAENKDFTFSYIGRTKANFKNSILLPPTFGKDLGEKLGRYDVYISASRFDPGPNHIIESLACKLPTYAHIESGGAVEMVGNTHVYDSFDSLTEILRAKQFHNNDEGLAPDNWKECMKKYFESICEIS